MKYVRGNLGKIMLNMLVLGLCLVGCKSNTSNKSSNVQGGTTAGSSQHSNEVGNTGEDNSTNSTSRDNTPKVLIPDTDQSNIIEGQDVSLDASSINKGYILLSYSGNASKVRMLITCPNGNVYNYLIPLDKQYGVYPLTEGSGIYNIAVYENVYDDQYAELFAKNVDVSIIDDKSVYLYPNEYIDFNESTKAVAKGSELAKGASTDLDVVASVYHYITENISYDYDKAETVKSGYVPVVDETLSTNSGICFDYASLMATMLRTQRIPTRLEMGYVGDLYHAWISVYIEDVGWIDNIIEFDGKNWRLMDPTLASYADKSTIKDYMKNSDTKYKIKFNY